MYARKRSKVLAMTHWWSQRVTSPIFGKTTNGDCRTFELQRQLTSRAKTFRKRDNALIDRRDQIAREIRSLSLCVILIERIQARREPWTRTPNGHLTNLGKHIQKGKCYKKRQIIPSFKCPTNRKMTKVKPKPVRKVRQRPPRPLEFLDGPNRRRRPRQKWKLILLSFYTLTIVSFGLFGEFRLVNVILSVCHGRWS